MDDNFKKHDPERVDYEMTDRASVELSVIHSPSVPAPVDTPASRKMPVVLPSIYCPPRDDRSCTSRLCDEHLRPHNQFEADDVGSIAALLSDIGLRFAAIKGNGELTWRRALQDTDSDTSFEPLGLEVDSLRADAALSDEAVSHLLEQVGKSAMSRPMWLRAACLTPSPRPDPSTL